eukprot:TRINITY_DN14224_c0_g1_i1.p1 TRINITY_DN14224_c0_g1~~TRINITY_DN14224_c0_g1_i1.p1  ORF type:complete len:144 (+),score=21.72 TRINITY_DN14224_c0_g1_i1:35-466(+)
MAESKSAVNLRSEKLLKAKWDRCIETSIVKTSVGTVIGGLASLILLRKPVSRALGTGLGAGFGMGFAYSECRYDFEHNLRYGRLVKKAPKEVPTTPAVAPTIVAVSAPVQDISAPVSEPVEPGSTQTHAEALDNTNVAPEATN